MSLYQVDDQVIVEEGAVIQPFAVVTGKSVLKKGCVVESFSYVCNSVVGRNTVVKSSRIVDSVVGDNCTVGPNAHLRDETRVGNGCRIGNFVEIKRSAIGNKVKAAHLAYIGDAVVGDNTNVGCGVIFVNYDGRAKHKTVVGNNCFVGCNSNLVAPVTIGNDCYVACGTTVNHDAPDGSFLIGRSYLTIKENRAEKYLKKD